MSQLNQEPLTPWYKEPWMILVIGLPVLSVMGGIAMVTVAVNGRDTLVRENYYKDGLAINQELAWNTKAANLDLTGELTFNEKQLSLTLNTPKSIQPLNLNLSLNHPTQAHKDQVYLLERFKPGQYLSPVNELPSGRYYLEISSNEQSWRISMPVVLNADTPVAISSKKH